MVIDVILDASSSTAVVLCSQESMHVEPCVYRGHWAVCGGSRLLPGICAIILCGSCHGQRNCSQFKWQFSIAQCWHQWAGRPPKWVSAVCALHPPNARSCMPCILCTHQAESSTCTHQRRCRCLAARPCCPGIMFLWMQTSTQHIGVQATYAALLILVSWQHGLILSCPTTGGF